MMDDKQKWKKIVIISAIGIILILFISSLIYTYAIGPPTRYSEDYIWMDTDTTYYGWEISILLTNKQGTKIVDGECGIPIEEIHYQLNKTDVMPINDILNKLDQNKSIIFYDNNNNSLLDRGDTFEVHDTTDNPIMPHSTFSLYTRTDFTPVILE